MAEERGAGHGGSLRSRSCGLLAASLKDVCQHLMRMSVRACPNGALCWGAMIDTHCHLEPDTLNEAALVGLEAVVSVGTNLEGCRRTLALAEAHGAVWAVLGVHPNSADEATPETRGVIESLSEHPKVVGVGETGFDTYWDEVSLDVQQDVFFWHAELAKRLRKPLVLHVRDKQGREDASLAARDAILEAGHARGILHCCNGHEGLVQAGLDLGWYVSFAGNLTYKNARNLQAAAKLVPEERLLVETDSPYLAPEPRRGRPNVPANVRYTAAFLAELRGVALEGLEPLLDANAQRVYGLPD